MINEIYRNNYEILEITGPSFNPFTGASNWEWLIKNNKTQILKTKSTISKKKNLFSAK